MATSISRSKEGSAIGKAKMGPSSNSHTTSTSTKKTTKQSIRSSSRDHIHNKRSPSSNSHTTFTSTKGNTKPSTSIGSSDHIHKATASEKQIPNNLKPTTSYRLESHFHSIKHLKGDSAPQKPTLNQRPLLEKPPIPTKSPKRKEPSSSRLHKALVSPSPPHKTLPQVRSSSTPTPLKPTISSKPFSKKTSKTPSNAKRHPILFVKKVNSKKTAPPTKKGADASANSTKTPESADTTAEMSRVETVPQVTDQEAEVLKVEDDEHHEVEDVSEMPPPVDSTEHENQEGGVLKAEDDEHHEVENLSEIPPCVDSTEHEHEQHHELEESDQPHIQADDERVVRSESEDEPIPIIEVKEAKGEPQEEKTKDEREEEESTHQGESNNGRYPEEHSSTEGDVKFKEKKEGGIIEEHKSENNNEEKASEEKEGDERGISEDKIDNAELLLEREVEEAKTESTPLKQEAGNKSQAYNNVIEETAGKLLETRKNKVRALVGAFQTAIDHQTSSK